MFSLPFQIRKFSELTDMTCQRHMCRSGPAEVAHFDFQLPETCAGALHYGVSFSGILEMCVVRGKSMLRTHFDVYPVCVKLFIFSAFTWKCFLIIVGFSVLSIASMYVPVWN